MPIDESVLKKLKEPFGILIPDKEITKERIIQGLKKAPMLVAVGDATTERLVGFGIIPNVAVIDGMERRSKRKAPPSYEASELTCSNPPGSISKEALGVLRQAVIGAHPVRVIVDGEEDLLALPLFSMVPLNSAVCYGQPLEGLVLVRISAAKRHEAKILANEILTDAGIDSQAKKPAWARKQRPRISKNGSDAKNC